MFCPNCGNYNEDSKFCSVCRASLAPNDSFDFSMDNQQYQNGDPEYNQQDAKAWDYTPNYDQPNYQQSNYQPYDSQPYNSQPYMQQQAYTRDRNGQAAQNLYMNPSGFIPGKGAGIASLIMGILSLLFCCIPFLGLVFAIVGLITGMVSIIKSNKYGSTSGLGIGGLICSIIGLLIGSFYTIGILSALWEFMYFY